MYVRILIHSFQRTLLASLPLMAVGLFNPASAQLQLNQPEAKLEALSIIEGRIAHPATRASLTPAQWVHYGERIAEALAEKHEGLRQSALRMVIQYGNDLELKRPAVLDMVRMYRGHENVRVRRMAVVALAQSGDSWAMDFLQRSLKYEKEPQVLHTLKAVVAEYRRGIIEVGEPQQVQN